MAEAVVDPLEVVDVHQQQRERLVAVAGEALLQAADERWTVAQAGQVVGVGQPLDALLGQLVVGDVFVDADVVGQLAVVVVHLGDRQLAPVRLEVLAPAAELALPAVVLGQAGARIEEDVAEVPQRLQLGQAFAAHLVGAVQGDRGEARVDVFHQAVAVDQQEGAGALLDGALEQVLFCGAIERRALRRRFDRQQVAAQQLATMLLEGLAELDQLAAAAGRVQGVVDAVVRAGEQLLLDVFVQAVARVRFHQAGIGRADQAAQLARGQAELALAGRVEEQQCPAGLVEALEAQHAQSCGNWQLRHNLGHRSADGIGMAFHQAMGIHYADRTGVPAYYVAFGKGASCQSDIQEH
ncbi:hypothetical protein D9M69_445570 [compost metagenome]